MGMGLRAWVALVAAGASACGARSALWEPPPTCSSRWIDCDGDGANGCEVDPTTDAANCGACGVVCSAGLACAHGACVPGETLVEIESMLSTVFVRSADGRVIVWGSNKWGGNPTLSDTRGTGNPASEEPNLLPQQLDLPEPVVEVRPSDSTTCARGVSGRVWCWGYPGKIPGTFLGDWSGSFIPVPGVTGARALMATEHGHCALDAEGRGLCWSGNDWDELSSGAAHPIAVPLLSAVEMSAFSGVPLVAIYPGLAAVERGPIITWGTADTLGVPVPVDLETAKTPRAVPDLLDPVRVDAGRRSYCVGLRDGRVLCWGVEIRPPSPAYEPFLAFEHGPYKKVTVNENLCALSHAGHVDCNDAWNDDVDRDGVADIASGIYFFCLLMQDGRVLCKGDNSEGQLGNGTGEDADQLIEVKMPALE